MFSCVERLRKPHPAIYALAASRLGVMAGSCVFAGDGADHELYGASAIGMRDLAAHRNTDPPAGWAGPAITQLSDIFTHLH